MNKDVFQYEAADGAVFSFEPCDGGARICDATLSSPDVIIPDVLNGLPVVSIAREAFSNDKTLKSLRVPASIREIDKRAFENCANLERLEFPDELDEFDRSWVVGCHALASIVLPGQIPTIDAEALGDFMLTSLVIGSGTHSLGDIPFAKLPLEHIAIHPANEVLSTDGHGIINVPEQKFIVLAVDVESYRIPEGCTSVGYKAFDLNRTIRSVEIPEGVIEIGELAFATSSVEHVSLPSTLTFLGTKAFASCKNLKHLELPAGLRVISDAAFQDSGLDSLDLPASIDRIGLEAFAGTALSTMPPRCTLTLDPACERFFIDEQGVLYRRAEGGLYLKELLNSNLSRLVVREGTVEIEPHACERHRHLRTVELPAGLERIGMSAFRSCEALTTLSDCPTLQSIDGYAFFKTRLQSLHLPASFKALGDCAIITCRDARFPLPTTIEEVTVDDECMTFWVERDMLCERQSDGGVRVHLYFGNRQEVIIGRNITSIAPYAFCCARGVRSIHLHEGLTAVGYRGLAIYQDLTHIDLDLDEPIDGMDCISLDFIQPTIGMNVIFEYMRAGNITAEKLMETYDKAIPYCASPFERMKRFTERLHDPYLLSASHQVSFQTLLTARLEYAFKLFAQNDFARGFDMLFDLGLLTQDNISRAIDIAADAGSVTISGYLLQMQFERFRKGGFDFDL